MEYIEEKIQDIVQGQLGVMSQKEPTFSELGADSLDKVEMLMALEEVFDISVTDTDAEKFIRVSDVVAYIKSNFDAEEIPIFLGTRDSLEALCVKSKQGKL